jgi:hypothetical protein
VLVQVLGHRQLVVLGREAVPLVEDAPCVGGDLVPQRPEVRGQGGLIDVASSHVVGGRRQTGPRGLHVAVEQRQAELAGQAEHVAVVGVDERSAEVVHQTARRLDGVGPAADPVAGLVDGGGDACLSQAIRGVEPRESRTDDRDAGAGSWCRLGEHLAWQCRAQRRGGGDDRRVPEEVAA